MTGEKNNFLLDRCWADHITFGGCVLSVEAARSIKNKRYKRAATFTAGAALADLFDGLEARRFTRRHPEAGAERQKNSAIKDQLADRVRNILITGAMLKNEDVPRRIKPKLGMVLTRELITLTGAGVGAIKLKKEEGVSAPPTPPSPPVGKEAVWWIAEGAGAGIVAAHCKETGHTGLEKLFTGTADTLLTAGVVRSVQATIEAGTALWQMQHLEADTNEAEMWEPNYSPHIGQIAMRGVAMFRRWREASEPQAA